MFPEYRDLIAELRQSDTHFTRLFDRHNELDHEIINLENNPVVGAHSQDEIDTKKREKLHLKDQMHQILQKVTSERQTN